MSKTVSPGTGMVRMSFTARPPPSRSARAGTLQRTVATVATTEAAADRVMVNLPFLGFPLGARRDQTLFAKPSQSDGTTPASVSRTQVALGIQDSFTVLPMIGSLLGPVDFPGNAAHAAPRTASPPRGD